jgi:hypothetical protein
VVAAHGIQISLLEAGPVAGEFRDRMGGADGRNASGTYAEQWKSFLAISDAGFDNAEHPDEVADHIVRIAGEAEPYLRYQTTETTTKLIGYKMADLDGTRITKLTSRWLR